MAITVDGLRRAYPVITAELYPDERVEYWLGEAQLDVRRSLWGNWYERGIYAYAAHNLIAEKAELDANDDGLGGIEANRGPVISESEAVDGISHSVSYAGAVSADSSSGASEWETTRPGKRYWHWARLVSVAKAAIYVE